jgi:acetyl-CoA C-acetyltransferase
METDMDDVVIVAALRTTVGKFCGSLSTVAAADMGASVIKALLEKTGVDPATISEVILGQVSTASVGQNATRQAGIKSGLPDTILHHHQLGSSSLSIRKFH